jgi:hypothetical protein
MTSSDTHIKVPEDKNTHLVNHDNEGTSEAKAEQEEQHVCPTGDLLNVDIIIKSIKR